MSIFKKIISFFVNIFGSTTWEQEASNSISLVAPLIETIVTLTAGESNSATVANVIKEVQTDLTDIVSFINGTGPNVNVTSVLNSIISNLDSLLAAGHIKNAVTLTKVTSIVTTIINEIEAILKIIPTSK